MARKPHLVAMSYDQLTEYRRRIRLEQAAVLSELLLRNEYRDVEPGRPDLPMELWDIADESAESSAS